MFLSPYRAPSLAAAQPLRAPITPATSAFADVPNAALIAEAPLDRICSDDKTHMPVIDGVSRHLANSRLALLKKKGIKAAEAMRAVACAMSAQANPPAAADRRRAAVDAGLARGAHIHTAPFCRKARRDHSAGRGRQAEHHGAARAMSLAGRRGE